jgi:hypothetical protein
MKENMAANEVLPFASTKKNMINKLEKQSEVQINELDKPEVSKHEVFD